MPFIKNINIKGTVYDLKANYDGVGNVINTTYASKTELNKLGDRTLLLEDKIFPYSLAVSGGGIFEKGTSQTITVSWTMKKGDTVITPDSVKINSTPVTGSSKQFTGVTSTTLYTVEATKNNKTKQGTVSATFVAASYCGVVPANFTVSEVEIKKLVKTIKNTKNHTVSNLNLVNLKVCYAFPKSLGNLTTIKDANNFDYINSYIKSELAINGELYNIYILKDATSVSNFKQVYS